MSTQLPADIVQITADCYINSQQFPENAKIAIIGDGASGRQIAYELASTHKVTLFCGQKRPLLPHQFFGRDLFWWLDKTKLLYADTHSLLGKIMQRRNPNCC